MKFTALTLGLALACAVAWAQDNNANQGANAPAQNGNAAQNTNGTGTAPTTAPGSNVTTPALPAGTVPAAPAGAVTAPAQNVTPAPTNNVNQGVNAPAQNATPAQNPNDTGTAPAPATPGGAVAIPAQPGAPAQFQTPLQGWVSQNVEEVGILSQQADLARAENRPEVARDFAHMIRDHVLASDAGKLVLAREGNDSRPVILLPDQPPPANLADAIRQDIAMHQQAISDTQNLLANATAPAEKTLYQDALKGMQNHLDWLQRLDRGERVDLGYFGPATPLTTLASLPVHVTTQRVAGYQEQTSRYHRVRHRRHHRVRYRRYRRY